MKKYFVLIIVAGLGLQVNAQFGTEILYNMPAPGTLPINIHLHLGNGVKMTLELIDRSQLDSLGNIDSLLHKVWVDLSPLKENNNKPFASRRIDYIAWPTNPEFRLLEHANNGSTYQYKKSELVQTKISPDTLRIRLQTTGKGAKSKFPFYRPLFVTLTLNNWQDIATIQPATLASGLAMVQVAKENKTINNGSKKMSAFYDVNKQQWSSLSAVNGQRNRKYVEPDLYVAFQYVRGAWVPSAAAGLQLINGQYSGKRKVFKLLWEPHFFFSRDISNSLIADRNDFITFRYYDYEAKPSDDDDYPLSFSIGYLVNRNGSWYEKNTIKLSVPGIQYKFLSLEPEFFFNDFFKQFSPSLKLNFNID